MSLALIQDYSSAKEEEEEEEEVEAAEQQQLHYENSSDDEDAVDDDDAAAANRSAIFQVPHPEPSSSSTLPSALDAFSQISGPPQFLNDSVEQKASATDVEYDQTRSRNRKNKQHLPVGAVMEAKAQLVGIHERVRSDIESNQPPASVSSTQGVKRVATATNPNAEDAAELLRMCLQCGVPKTYSNARGMICPVCRDRPATDPSQEPNKRGSTIKDKEKSKRMKGQSSHATWKSETEMQLRQQFD